MGILSVHRNLLSNCKSQLKYLSSSSNLWFIRRISSPAGLCKAQSHAPTGDLKSNNKLMFLIEHFHGSNYTENSWEGLSVVPPHKYSLISAENSWTDHHHNFCNPFSRYGVYTFAGSCNELMLVLFYNLDARFDGYGKYLLWNPTTNKIKLLPPPGPTSNNIHGFGFDTGSGDYKLIRFPLYRSVDCCEDVVELEVHLYSLKTNSWKKIAYPSCGIKPSRRPCVHVNGFYYWEAILSTSAIILSFDFANEKFSSAPHIPQPPNFNVHSRGTLRGLLDDDFVLVEFDGSLAALVHSEMGDLVKPFSFEVWGWNGESWLEKVPRTTFHVHGGVDKVLGLFQDDKLFLQGCQKGEVLLYYLSKSKLENLGILADEQMVNIFPFYARSSIPIPFMGNK